MNRSFVSTTAPSDTAVAAYMRQVFNYMTGGVALTALVAYFMTVAGGGAYMQQMVTSGAYWVFLIAQLGLVLFLSFRLNKIEPGTALALFAGYSALTGLTLAPLVFAFTQASVVQAFVVAAGMFAAMSFYGYVTKRSLTGMGSFLFMGLVGIVIASLVNIFLASSQMAFIISLIAVPLFAGLTAYDTQRIKEQYAAHAGDELTTSRLAIMGALSLYLDFINLFIHLLQLMGERR